MTEGPLRKKLKGHTLILGSASPRRKLFLEQMGLEFQWRTKPVDEVHPKDLKAGEISEYLAKLKADAFRGELGEGEILMTSDTVVWHQGVSLAKPKDGEEAIGMLQALSGDWHQVISSVCFTTRLAQTLRTATTRVRFRDLSQEEIEYYVDTYRPLDKAGAYGIQEWIGLVGIVEIQGSHPNVVGLPTHLVYGTLMELLG